MTILAATGNAGKLKELRAILEGLGHTVKSPAELGLTLDPDETGASFAENACIKAEAFARASGLASLADDSGLCVDALGGAPGIFSARYAGGHGNDAANNAKLLEALADTPRAARSAHFHAAVCLALPEGRRLVCEGECPGFIASELRPGDYGFGYDPLFIPSHVGKGQALLPNTEERSYAQLLPAEKNAVSHRARALAALAERLPQFLAAL